MCAAVNDSKAAAAAAASSGAASSTSTTTTTSTKHNPYETHHYVGPYRLEKTLGKGQTGKKHSSSNEHRQRIPKIVL